MHRIGGDHIHVYIALLLASFLHVNTTQIDDMLTKGKAQEVEVQSVEDKSVQEESEWETWELTAYTDAPEENGGWTITASGGPFTDDQTLACPKSIPFGTEIEIDGIGVRTCHDRGGAIKGKRIDVFIRDADEMQRFGRQKRKIRIFDE